MDYITPIVDDPESFGAIAAANALSDIYAMGGRSVLAFNLVGFPIQSLPPVSWRRSCAAGRPNWPRPGSPLAAATRSKTWSPNTGWR